MSKYFLQEFLKAGVNSHVCVATQPHEIVVSIQRRGAEQAGSEWASLRGYCHCRLSSQQVKAGLKEFMGFTLRCSQALHCFVCSRWKWPIFDLLMSLNVVFGSFVCDQWWHQEPCYNAVSEALLTFSPTWWNADPLQPQSKWCPMYITRKISILCWEMIPSLGFSGATWQMNSCVRRWMTLLYTIYTTALYHLKNRS